MFLASPTSLATERDIRCLMTNKLFYIKDIISLNSKPPLQASGWAFCLSILVRGMWVWFRRDSTDKKHNLQKKYVWWGNLFDSSGLFYEKNLTVAFKKFATGRAETQGLVE